VSPVDSLQMTIDVEMAMGRGYDLRSRGSQHPLKAYRSSQHRIVRRCHVVTMTTALLPLVKRIQRQQSRRTTGASDVRHGTVL